MKPQTILSATLAALGIISVAVLVAQSIGANVFVAATIGAVLGGGYAYRMAMPVPYAVFAGMTNALTIFGIIYYERHMGEGVRGAWLLLIALLLDAAVFVAQRRVRFRVG